MLTIFLVSLLAISAVSAADNATTDVVSVEEITVDVVKETTDEIVNVSTNDVNDTVMAKNNEDPVSVIYKYYDEVSVTEKDILSASSGSFSDLANEIKNGHDEIYLTRNYVYSEMDSDYISGIKIDKPITIYGNGFVIDGKNKARAFEVSSNYVFIKDVKFRGCYNTCFQEYNGGTIANSNGGAIKWTGSDGALVNCLFNECRAITYSTSITSSAISNAYGGAILMQGGNNVLENCNFTDCSVFSSAISMSYRDYAAAISQGGAFFSYFRNILKNCVFNGCSATSESSNSYTSNHQAYGGAIYIRYSHDSNITNCSFINCTSITSSKLDEGYADSGAIYFMGSGLISNSEFIECSSMCKSTIMGILERSFGGAISILPYTNIYKTRIDSCIFKSNKATKGGVLFINKMGDVKPDCEIINSIFIQNVANEGSCIYLESGEGFIKDSILINNSDCCDIFSKDSSFTADYNWWGNTIDDYTLPKYSSNILINNWLFLNLTTKKNVLKIGDEIKITFNLNNLFDGNIVTKYNSIDIHNLNFSILDDDIAKIFSINNGFGEMNYIAKKAPTGSLLVKYENIEKLFEFEIERIFTNILSSTITVVFNSGKYLVATLNDEYGNALMGVKLTVVLDGKTYTQTTNNNGQIKISTNGLAPVKTYKATITFKGNSKYEKSITTAKVTVKKATPKLSAKAKTFKKSVKTKKYTVTLKTNQNKVMKNTKLTLKVNGKTYTAKTNAKGQATFKITKLTKKGTFKATITYKGSAYYNKVTKNININCK